MWAYRISDAVNHLGMTTTVGVLRKRLADTAEIVELVYKLDERVAIAKNMARALGWDMTMAKEPLCFLVPTTKGFEYGIMITQATGRQNYVVSPVPLKFLEESVDWNAHISEEEVTRAQGALEGDTKMLPPPVKVGEWQQSRKGNYYTTINGALCTIFPTNNGGFKAVISAGDRKVYTKAFANEVECAEDVIKNFYTLVKEWSYLPGDTAANSPFSGVNWGDDDDIPF